MLKIQSCDLKTLSDKQCPLLDEPFRGTIEFSDALNVGSRAKYFCEPGYVLKGNRVRQCLSDGSWTGKKPSCVRKRQRCRLRTTLTLYLQAP